MTWSRFSPEIVTEAARDQLSQAEFLLYLEVCVWVYATEDSGLKVPRHMLPRITTVDCPDDAAAGLVKRGWWKQASGGWQIVHGASVMRQSFISVNHKRASDRKAQATARARKGKRQ
jgi:hypothetical protein